MSRKPVIQPDAVPGGIAVRKIEEQPAPRLMDPLEKRHSAGGVDRMVRDHGSQRLPRCGRTARGLSPVGRPPGAASRLPGNEGSALQIGQGGAHHGAVYIELAGERAFGGNPGPASYSPRSMRSATARATRTQRANGSR